MPSTFDINSDVQKWTLCFPPYFCGGVELAVGANRIRPFPSKLRLVFISPMHHQRLVEHGRPTAKELCKLIDKKDVAAVRSLVERGLADPNEKCGDTTPFGRAIRTDSVELVELMLRCGGNINLPVWKQHPPLLYAVMAYRSVDVMLMLMEAGANRDHTFKHAGVMMTAEQFANRSNLPNYARALSLYHQRHPPVEALPMYDAVAFAPKGPPPPAYYGAQHAVPPPAGAPYYGAAVSPHVVPPPNAQPIYAYQVPAYYQQGPPPPDAAPLYQGGPPAQSPRNNYAPPSTPPMYPPMAAGSAPAPTVPPLAQCATCRQIVPMQELVMGPQSQWLCIGCAKFV